MDAKTDTAVPSAAEMVARARAMIPALRKRAAQDDKNRRIAKETIAEMQEAGLFRVLQPKRWDGYELDVHTYFDVQMALAEGDMSVAWVYGVVGVHPWAMGLFDDRAVHDVWGRDRSVLISSSLMPSGAAMPVDGGYRVTGRWKYSSGCDHCDWAFLGATIGGDTGSYADRCVFLLPRSDYEIVDTWRVSGLKSTGSQDIAVKDAFVPGHRMLRYADNFRGVAPGLAINTSPLYRLPWGQVFSRRPSLRWAITARAGMARPSRPRRSRRPLTLQRKGAEWSLSRRAPTAAGRYSSSRALSFIWTKGWSSRRCRMTRSIR